MSAMPKLSDEARAAYAAVGVPPADPDELLTWGRRALAQTAWLLMTGEIDATRARAIKDSVFAIGATHNRAKLEGKVQRLKDAVSEFQQAGSAITEVPGSSVKRPPTARGGPKPGPKPVADDPSDDGNV